MSENKAVKDIALLTTYAFLVVGLYMLLFIVFITLHLLGLDFNLDKREDVMLFIVLGLAYPIGIYFLLLRFRDSIHTEDYPLKKH